MEPNYSFNGQSNIADTMLKARGTRFICNGSKQPVFNDTYENINLNSHQYQQKASLY